jgi:hypothetical protein
VLLGAEGKFRWSCREDDIVTELSRPDGLPIATTNCPGCAGRSVPSGNLGRCRLPTGATSSGEHGH